MATFVKREARGKVVWMVRIRRKGQPPLAQTFERQKDGEAWAARMEAAISEERAVPGRLARRHTLSEAITRYTTTELQRKRWSTARNQLHQLAWWQERLGPKRLADITPASIAEHRDALKKQCREATVVRYLAVLSHLFSIAVKEWQWVESNPMQRVGKPTEPRGRDRFLRAEELQQLLTACKASRSGYLYPLVLLALSTGGRRGELLNLTWQDVDSRRGAVTFRDTKNTDTRTVAVKGHTLAVLQDYAKVRQMHDGRVFPGKGQRQLETKRAWCSAMRKAGLADFRFHDLRYSAASYLAMSGATLVDIGAILGHKTLAVTGRYTHLTHSHTEQVLDRMRAAYLDQL